MTTCAGIEQIAALGEKHLPEGVERSKRVFMPERMFMPGRLFSPKKGGGGAVVPGGVHGLGIGLVQRPELLETTFNVFDVRHHLSVHFGDGSDG